MAEGWPTEHTEHTEGFLTGEDGVIGGRRAEGGGQMTDGEVMSDQWMVIGDWGANRDNLNRRKAILPSR